MHQSIGCHRSQCHETRAGRIMSFRLKLGSCVDDSFTLCSRGQRLIRAGRFPSRDWAEEETCIVSCLSLLIAQHGWIDGCYECPLYNRVVTCGPPGSKEKNGLVAQRAKWLTMAGITPCANATPALGTLVSGLLSGGLVCAIRELGLVCAIR